MPRSLGVLAELVVGHRESGVIVGPQTESVAVVPGVDVLGGPAHERWTGDGETADRSVHVGERANRPRIRRDRPVPVRSSPPRAHLALWRAGHGCARNYRTQATVDPSHTRHRRRVDPRGPNQLSAASSARRARDPGGASDPRPTGPGRFSNPHARGLILMSYPTLGPRATSPSG